MLRMTNVIGRGLTSTKNVRHYSPVVVASGYASAYEDLLSSKTQ
jgi:hypothetical protein